MADQGLILGVLLWVLLLM